MDSHDAVIGKTRKEGSVMSIAFVPIPELMTPKTGYEVLVNHHWVVDPEKGALFYKRTPDSRDSSPQCNRDENVAIQVRDKLYPKYQVRKIPIAYVWRNY